MTRMIPPLPFDLDPRHMRHRARHYGLAGGLRALHAGWRAVFAPELGRPPLSELRALVERLEALIAADVHNTRAGVYPTELLQFPLIDYLRQMPAPLVEMARIWRRRREDAYDDLPPDVDLDAYPRYYRRTFHWQTDGWLSDRSARVYDIAVEFLFAGYADVMRRMAIPPLVEHLAPGARVADLACGTGRFLGQLAAARPDLCLTGVDLSPYYLDHARRAVTAPVEWIEANAEALPLPDASLDAASSVFLFHELPRDVRRRVMREALRALRPGGRFVVCDSIQLSDSPEFTWSLDAFHATYHEPYFKGYIRDDLAAALTEVGFEVVDDRPWAVAKVVVARKPT